MRNFNITVDGKAYSVSIEETNVTAAAPVAVAAPVAAPAVKAPAPAPAPKAAAPAGGTPVSSPMPGMVVSFKVQNGDTVKKGQVVVVLEAMKMENDIAATADGVITIVAQKGANVNTGDILATIN